MALSQEIKRNGTFALVVFAILFFVSDLLYKTIYSISYLNREKCILYQTLPKFWFLFFEYFFELFFIVVVGVFIAVLLEFWFSRYNRFYPKNSVTAFLYASLLPVCACSTIPMIGSMRGKLPFRAIITFVVAAPLLSPYIIVLSFSVLGTKYALMRICGSFILAVSAGFVVNHFSKGDHRANPEAFIVDPTHVVGDRQGDIYLKTHAILRGLLPYFLVAAVMGLAIEWAAPANFLTKLEFSNNISGIIISILIGIPIYLCHGAEILLLRPLIHQSGLSGGATIAFSLASTSICMTSLALIIRFIGKKLATILVGNLVVIIFLIGLLIDFF
jgi:uncharacterized protein